MRADYLLISAYAVAWLFLLVYILSLGLKLRDMRRDIEQLKKK